MKVIHIISELNIGGAEMHLAKLLPHLAASFDQEVCCLMGHGPVASRIKASGIPVTYLNIQSRFNPIALIRLYKYLKQKRPDAIITYLVYADILGRLTGKAAKVPRIISSQRSSLHRQTWLRYIDMLTRKLVDQYVVQTKALAAKLRRLGYQPRSLTVIPNMVAIPPAPAALNTNIIICVGSLKEGKGHRLLLQVFQLVHATCPNWKLLLVGTGPLEKELREQANAQNLPVEFLGQRLNIPSLLQSASLFILPTEAEGMSNAILEAMAAGLPCITSDIPPNREIITSGRTGILISTFSTRGYADALQSLITHQSLRHTLGTSARQYVRNHHSPETIADQWKNLLTSL